MLRMNVWRAVDEGKVLVRGCIEQLQTTGQKERMMINIVVVSRFSDPYSTAGEQGTGLLGYRNSEPMQLQTGKYHHGPLDRTIGAYGMHETQAVKEHLTGLATRWSHFHPLWCSREQVVMTKRYMGKEEPMGSAHYKAMEHYAILQEAVAARYYIVKETDDALAWAFLETLHDRLQAFRRSMDKVWLPTMP